MDNDISKIISLIMENPSIIEEIKSLAKSNTGANSESEEKSASIAPEDTRAISDADSVSAATYKSEAKSTRRQLLYALKPYLSEERSRAIDSMLNISDIIEIARRR